jgi:hypothetical protein
MNIESITLYLARKHFGSVEINAEVNKLLGEGSVGYSTIVRYLRMQSFLHSSEVAEEEAKIGSSQAIDPVILQVLNEQPSASLWQFARRIMIRATAIRYHLVNKMRCKIKGCK